MANFQQTLAICQQTMAPCQQTMATCQQTILKWWKLLLDVLPESLGSFQHTVLNWWLLICAEGNVYFWVVGFSSLASVFTSKHDAAASPSAFPSAPAPSVSHHCTPENIWSVMDIWLRWMATLLVASLVSAYLVKTMVDTDAAVEAKLYGEEIKAYKALRHEADEAETLLKQINVGEENYEEELRKHNELAKRVESEKPKEGLERQSTVRQRWMRWMFVAAILFSLATGVCASVAFYLSLQMRAGCKNRPVQIFPHIFVGLVFLGAHLNAIAVALTRN